MNMAFSEEGARIIHVKHARKLEPVSSKHQDGKKEARQKAHPGETEPQQCLRTVKAGSSRQ